MYRIVIVFTINQTQLTKLDLKSKYVPEVFDDGSSGLLCIQTKERKYIIPMKNVLYFTVEEVKEA